ncbi:MAG: hypothetical protein RLZZ306_3260 [Bacteroidota bacterium]|jgi:hypothetical protein
MERNKIKPKRVTNNGKDLGNGKSNLFKKK